MEKEKLIKVIEVYDNKGNLKDIRCENPRVRQYLLDAHKLWPIKHGEYPK